MLRDRVAVLKTAMVLLAGVTALGGGCAPIQIIERTPEEPVIVRTVPDTMRGLQVARASIGRVDDALTMVRSAAASGVTDLYIPARISGELWYAGEVEPVVSTIEGSGDVFAEIVAAATAEDIRVHAVISALVLWDRPGLPLSAGHAVSVHPEWRVFDTRGVPQRSADGKIYANPVLPEVRERVASVAAEVASRYDIDGVLLTDIGFPEKTLDPWELTPGDQRSISMFIAEAGVWGVDTLTEQQAFREWKRDRITSIVQSVRRSVSEVDPRMLVGAAVAPHPMVASQDRLQDAVGWVRWELADYIVPVSTAFQDVRAPFDLEAWQIEAPSANIIAGLALPGALNAGTPNPRAQDVGQRTILIEPEEPAEPSLVERDRPVP